MATEAPIVAQYFTAESKTLRFTIYQSDGVTAQDISNWSLSWMLKRRQTDADVDALITKTTPSDVSLTSPTTGLCEVTLTDTDIANVRAAVPYHHELKRMDAGFETVLSYGAFQLGQAVHGT